MFIILLDIQIINMIEHQKVAVVTGSSSGIGLEISSMLARNGFKTYATMRNLTKSSELQAIADNEKLPLKISQLDVADDKSVNDAIQSIFDESNRIDVLVNNAGYGLTGALEDLTMDEIKSQYETNVFGLIRTTQSVIPIMRKQKSGTIVNISSGLGRFGIAASSAYVSSKFAVEGLSEAMSYELEPFGIRTIIIEPGVIKTNFINSSILAKKSQDPDSPYSQLIKGMKSGMDKLVGNGALPAYVAKVVVNAIGDKNPKVRYLAGNDVEKIIAMKSKMSDEDFHNMIKQN
jgi:NAD(P)-dependent dehydrogenase (short-subunit alcohol dehydrogenase family)